MPPERSPKKIDRGSVFECIQQPGEVLYVPTNWYHGVINLDASIGVAVEVGDYTELLGASLERETRRMRRL